jgi:hypothetical protein
MSGLALPRQHFMRNKGASSMVVVGKKRLMPAAAMVSMTENSKRIRALELLCCDSRDADFASRDLFGLA